MNSFNPKVSLTTFPISDHQMRDAEPFVSRKRPLETPRQCSQKRTKTESYPEHLSADCSKLIEFSYRTISVSQFSQLLGDSFLQHSKWDQGSFIEENLEYWIGEVQSWIEGTSYLPSPLDKETLEFILQDFEDCRLAQECLLRRDAAQLMDLASQRLNSRNRFVLIIGYSNSGSGHIFPIIFKRNGKGLIFCDLFNKGEGMQLHPPKEEGYRLKRSSQFFSIELKDPFIFESQNPVGLCLFEQLIDYRNVSQNINYKSKMIYQLILQFGTAEMSLPQGRFVTGQKSGTCGGQAIRLVIGDALYSRQLSSPEWLYKKSMFIAKFHAFLNAYHQLEQLPLQLIRDAMADFSFSISEKHTPNQLISCEENLASQALFYLLDNKLKACSPSTLLLDESSLEGIPQMIATDPQEVNKFFTPFNLNSNHRNELKTLAMQLVSPLISLECPPPEQLAERLLQILDQSKTMIGLFQSYDFFLIYHSLLHLPSPTHKEYWEKIPLNQIESCVKAIVKMNKLHIHANLDVYFPQRLVLILHSLAIIFHLAQRKPELHLENFRLHIDFSKINPFQFHHLGRELACLYEAQDYFASFDPQKPALFAFLFDREAENFAVSNAIQSLKKGDRKNMSYLAQHLSYLALMANKIEGLPDDYSERLALLLAIPHQFNNNPSQENKKYFSSIYYQLNELLSLFRDLIFHPTVYSHEIVVEKEINQNSHLNSKFRYRLSKKKSRFLHDLKLRLNLNSQSSLFKILQISPQILEQEIWISKENEVLADINLTPLHRKLAKIQAAGALKIPALIAFCLGQPQECERQEVQACLEFWLFCREDGLIHALRRQPSLIHSLRKILQRHLSHFSNSKLLQQYFFWVLLTYHVETHAAEVLGVNKEALQTWQSHLRGLLKTYLEEMQEIDERLSLICIYNIYTSSLSDPDQMEDLLTCWLIINFFSQNRTFENWNPPFWLPQVQFMEIAKNLWGIDQILSDQPAIAIKAIDKVLRLIGKISLENRQIECIKAPFLFKVSVDQDIYLIDLVQGSIYLNNCLFSKDLWPSSHIKNYVKKLFNKKPLPQLRSINPDLLESWDKELLIRKNSVFVLRSFDGEDSQYYEIKNFKTNPDYGSDLAWNQRLLGKTLESLFNKFTECNGYLGARSVYAANRHFVILYESTQKPYIKASFSADGSSCEMIRYDSKGKLTDEKLLLSPPPQWGRLFSGLIESKNVLFWAKEGRLSRIEILSLNQLNICFQEDGSAYLEPMPDYFLSLEQGLSSLNYTEGTLTFNRVKDDKQFVLIPDEDTYFLYELDSKTGHLYHESTAAQILLIQLFRAQGNYEEAAWCVQNFSHFNLEEEDLLAIMGLGEKKKQDPAYIAIYLKLILAIRYDKNLLKNDEILKKNLKKIFKYFRRYLSVTHSPEQGCLFPSLKLTRKEMVTLIDFLNDHSQRLQVKLPGMQRMLYIKTWLVENSSYESHIRHVLKFPIIKKIYARLKNISDYKDLPQHISGFDRQDSPFIPLSKMESDEFVEDLFPVLLAHVVQAPPEDVLIDAKLLNLHHFYIKRFGGYDEDYNQIFLVGLLSYIRYIIKTTGQSPLSLENPNFTPEIVKSAQKWFSDQAKLSNKIVRSVPLKPIAPSPSIENVSCPLSLEELSICFPSYEDLVEEYFIQTSVKLYEQDVFALSNMNLKDPFAQKILDNLTDQYVAVQSKDALIYHCRKDATLLADQLELRISVLSRTQQNLKEEIERLANESSSHILLKLIGRQISIYTVHDVLLYLIFRDQGKLASFQEEALLSIYHKAIEYMAVTVAIDQGKQAFQQLRQENFCEAGEILARKRSFDLLKFRELLFYEYASGTRLRQDQADLLEKIFTNLFEADREHVIFEFQAGGGKTKILSAIIAAKAIAEGHKVVFFSLPHLHDITKKDLKISLLQFFEHNLYELSLGLNSHLSSNEWKMIYKDIKKAQVVILKPEAFHAIHLGYQAALLNNEAENVQWISAILRLFQKKTVALIDEMHKNLSSLLHAQVAVGAPDSISNGELETTLQFYEILLSDQLQLKDSRTFKEALAIQENKQALLSSQERQEIILEALEIWIKNYCQGDAQALFDYCANNRSSVPDLDQASLQRLALVRGLVNEILPHTLSLVGEIDHGRAITPTPVEAPRQLKTPTTARFENPDVAICLSIQGYYQRGLQSLEEIALLIQILKTLPEPKKTRQMFLSWQQGPSKISLDSIERENLSQVISILFPQLRNHPQAIHYYLLYRVFNEVKVFENKIISTASDLVTAFLKAIMFSATVGMKEQYPYLKDSIWWPDLLFQTEVIHRSCLNSEIYWLKPTTPQQFFEDLYAKDPEIFATFEGFINLGGWIKQASNRNFALAFLKFSKQHHLGFNGVLTFENINSKKQLFLYQSDGIAKDASTVDLKQKGLIKIYGPSEVEGADLPFNSTATLVLAIGEGVAASSIVQATMRVRQFLKPPCTQRFIWVGPDKLREQIPDGSIKSCFAWGIHNEAQKLKKLILMRAYQEIEFVVRQHIKNQLQGKLAQKQIAKFHTHHKAFLYHLKRNPFQLYGQEQSVQETAQNLRSYAQDFVKKAGIHLKKSENVHLQEVIRQTANLIKEISTTKIFNLSATCLQEVKLHRQDQISQLNTRSCNSLNYAAAELSLNQLFNLSSSEFHYPVKTVYSNAPWFSDDLYMMSNWILTFQDDIKHKTIDYFLVVQGLKRSAYVISLDDARLYLGQLLNELNEGQAALFSSEGFLIQNGRSGFSDQELMEMESWIHEICMQIGLLNGKVRYPELMQKLLLQHKEEIIPFCQFVYATQIEPDPWEKEHMESLLGVCL